MIAGAKYEKRNVIGLLQVYGKFKLEFSSTFHFVGNCFHYFSF